MESPFRDTCPDDLRVIETLGCEPSLGLVRSELHLARMAHTCLRLGIPFDRADALARLAGINGPTRLRVRLTVGLRGDVDLESQPIGRAVPHWRVGVAPGRLSSADPWLTVKTTMRGPYDEARAALPAGVDEIIFLNERDEVCEGTITNVFVATPGGLLTPPLTSGVLPGILRGALIAEGGAREAVIRLDDLKASEAVFVGNSLRGLIPAELV